MLCSHCPTPRPIKMGCTELCGGVHTAQRQIPSQIPIVFCVNLSIYVSVSVSSSVNAPLLGYCCIQTCVNTSSLKWWNFFISLATLTFCNFYHHTATLSVTMKTTCRILTLGSTCCRKASRASAKHKSSRTI